MKMQRGFRLLNYLFQLVETKTQFIITYEARLKFRNEKKRFPPHSNISEKSKSLSVGILIQGPIHDEEFITHTIIAYCQRFENSQIILSTWDYEDTSELERQIADKKSQVKIIKSKFPTVSSYGNLQLQQISTLNGLNALMNTGVEYAIKTRTDQRFYDPEALQKLCSFFDLHAKNSHTILVASQNTFYFRLFGPSDTFQFGSLEALLKYWDVDLIKYEMVDRKSSLCTNTLRGEFHKQIPETFLFTSYLANLGEKVEISLKESWRLLKKYVVVMDDNFIDLVWTKYSHGSNRWFIYDSNSVVRQMSYSDWLVLNVEAQNNSDIEAYLDYEIKGNRFVQK